MDIFDSDTELDCKFNPNNEFARNYDNWRKSEELNKFKTKYGSGLLLDDNSSSSSSDDDDEGVEVTEELERDFFKTLSYLKSKDPKIYDTNTQFFDTADPDPSVKKEKKNKAEKPLFLKDYERKLILEQGGKLSDDEEDERVRSPTYVEEQQKLKDSLKEIVNNEESDDELGGLLKIRQKTEVEKRDDDYREWLSGEKEQIEDRKTESDLKPLKDYWANPNLDEGEKFLRDYILNKKFISQDNEDYIPTYDEIVHDSDENLSEDEKQIEQQDEFEQKFNFRFEEPDPDFIKRYPRTMENSVRRTDDKRKIKRQEIKVRKQREKEQKMQDLKKLQELKRKEIEEKIEKLKEITGNTDVAFGDDDIDGDFDPEAHDKRMQALFNDEFYQGPEGDQKPEFSALDEYLEIENWNYDEGNQNCDDNENDNVPHCEDEDFNMDCDYEPTKNTEKELVDSVKGKKKKKRKSVFAKAIAQPKPVFDPNDKTYEEYLDEYYKFDCEDIIGDVPCRFKYRKVVPNSFGLTIEEILMAKDRELNKWCSLKKAVQHRPDHVEKYEQIAYEKKAQNILLKKRTLPSLFEEEIAEQIDSNEPSTSSSGKKRRKKKKTEQNSANTIQEIAANVKKNKLKNDKIKLQTKTEKTISDEEHKNLECEDCTNGDNSHEVIQENLNNNNKKNKKRRRGKSTSDSHQSKKMKKSDTRSTINKNKKNKQHKGGSTDIGISNSRLNAYGINPKKFKNKLKYGKQKNP